MYSPQKILLLYGEKNANQMKNSKQKNVMDIVKASRKRSREEEIEAYGKPINYQKIVPSKKVYNRKKNKADANHLPYLLRIT